MDDADQMLLALLRSPVDGSLELLYQPEIELATGTIVAMEGLLRWHYSSLDGSAAGSAVVAPLDVLELAGSSEVVEAIGHWVLQTGAAEVARWQGLGSRQLWLNVSAGQLAEPGFPAVVAEVVRDAALPAGALGLELSETTVGDLGPGGAALLTDLRAAGAALAVDDCASVDSALDAIRRLPLSAVKLGQEHVRGVDRCDGAPAALIIGAAHDAGLYVVAEGVETWGEAARLSALGCDRAHGWLFASAQRADKARWLLSAGRTWRGSAPPAAPRA